MAEEHNFAKFIWFNKPHEKAPSWVIGNVRIKVEEFVAWLNEQETIEGYLNLDVKDSKKGNPYLEVNDYVKVESQSTSVAKDEPAAQTDTPDTEDPEDKKLPF